MQVAKALMASGFAARASFSCVLRWGGGRRSWLAGIQSYVSTKWFSAKQTLCTLFRRLFSKSAIARYSQYAHVTLSPRHWRGPLGASCRVTGCCFGSANSWGLCCTYGVGEGEKEDEHPVGGCGEEVVVNEGRGGRGNRWGRGMRRRRGRAQTKRKGNAECQLWGLCCTHGVRLHGFVVEEDGRLQPEAYTRSLLSST